MVIAAQSADPQLDALVLAIVERLQPELILLFGSRVRGDAHEDSDYDLLLVLRDGADVEHDRKAVCDLQWPMPISADVLACTVSDYQHRQHDPGFLAWLVSREGRLLYSRGTVPQRSPRTDRVREGGKPTEGRDIWVERAESDFQAAINSLGSAKPSWDAICFHAHACIEKLLKALIVSGGTYPPRTHVLKDLTSRLPKSARDEAELIAIAKLLDDVYPRSRYVEYPMPTPDEARAAFDAACRARDRLLKQLKQLKQQG
ncbi:MAG: HEPN domain-containing protein [Gemmatimonadaceae bacterium]